MKGVAAVRDLGRRFLESFRGTSGGSGTQTTGGQLRPRELPCCLGCKAKTRLPWPAPADCHPRVHPAAVGDDRRFEGP